MAKRKKLRFWKALKFLLASTNDIVELVFLWPLVRDSVLKSLRNNPEGMDFYKRIDSLIDGLRAVIRG